MTNNNEGRGFVNGFLFGGAIGFIVGVLAAPRSGEEIRSEISRWAHTLRGQAEIIAEQVRRHLNPDTPTEAASNGDTSKKD